MWVTIRRFIKGYKMIIRPIQPSDYNAWLALWDGYNAFYDRKDETALPGHITQALWERLFDLNEPVFALVAETDGQIVGLTHYLFHRRTAAIEPVCYLSDLFTLPAKRGSGIGRALINAVYQAAQKAGSKRVYWQTNEDNTAGRLLYDKVAKHVGFIVYTKDF
jgi:GNAT superfamily N-acetyltransferase